MEKSNQDNIKILRWSALVLTIVVVFLAMNFDFNRFFKVGAASQVKGEGTPRFLPKWVASTPPGSFNLSLGGSVACNSVSISWTASSGAEGYTIWRESPRTDITPYTPYTALNFVDTTVSENTSYLYQIEAYNGAGTKPSNALNVDTPYCPPTLNFSGSPTSIYEGQFSTLTWSTTYATSCTASASPVQSGWNGAKPVDGTQDVVPLPPPSVTYNLQCSGLGGTTPVQSVIINITQLGLPDWREIIPR